MGRHINRQNQVTNNNRACKQANPYLRVNRQNQAAAANDASCSWKPLGMDSPGPPVKRSVPPEGGGSWARPRAGDLRLTGGWRELGEAASRKRGREQEAMLAGPSARQDEQRRWSRSGAQLHEGEGIGAGPSETSKINVHDITSAKQRHYLLDWIWPDNIRNIINIYTNAHKNSIIFYSML
jgi:hypothetical protein